MSMRTLFLTLLLSWTSTPPHAAATATATASVSDPNRVYIVNMKQHLKPPSYPTNHHWYSATLRSLSDTTQLLYTYDLAYHGFAASMHPRQARSLESSDCVLGVYEDVSYRVHTTRTPHFLGLQTPNPLWEGHSTLDLNHASNDVIIGVLDTGVYPYSGSFSDHAMPPVPSRWRGNCQSSPDFPTSSCNRKLIGARSFARGFKAATGGISAKPQTQSPLDVDGHGTHTATTAAGSAVRNASLFGYASGTARGVAEFARIAAYKVCWSGGGCFGSDILAAIDSSISDGVHVLSLSLGGGSLDYYKDPIAIGAFAAQASGIFVSCSAGNSGPNPSTLANTAPWITTVGAGTIDRDFPAYVVLGNGVRIIGVSLYSGKGFGRNPVSLVYRPGTNDTSNLCLPGSITGNAARGKVVVCDRGKNSRVEKGVVVGQAGGVGMVLANTAESGEELVADDHLVPAVAVGRKMGDRIKAYISITNRSTALLSFGGTVLNVKPSPVVAAFSSRGPNVLSPQILKPDVIGPGVNILAGWSEVVGPTGLDVDKRISSFNIESGTSMSCPHISGVAALVKAAHPDWSPSAIRSAMMTSAYTLDSTKSPLRDAYVGQPSTPYAHGAGHVNPHKALSPGLIYDISNTDYISFLCSLNYTPMQLASVVRHQNVTCSEKLLDPMQLNYPSFSVIFNGPKRVLQYTRILTNVGSERAGYRAVVTAPDCVEIRVRPEVLIFRSVGEKRSYTVSFTSNQTVSGSKFGSIAWVNRRTQVTSPVAFSWP